MSPTDPGSRVQASSGSVARQFPPDPRRASSEGFLLRANRARVLLRMWQTPVRPVCWCEIVKAGSPCRVRQTSGNDPDIAPCSSWNSASVIWLLPGHARWPDPFFSRYNSRVVTGWLGRLRVESRPVTLRRSQERCGFEGTRGGAPPCGLSRRDLGPGPVELTPIGSRATAASLDGIGPAEFLVRGAGRSMAIRAPHSELKPEAIGSLGLGFPVPSE